MNLYNRYVLPLVLDRTCNSQSNLPQRKKVIPLAKGNVLEIGIGSGLNLPFYHTENVRHLTAIDPSLELWKKNSFDPNNLPFGFDFIKAFAGNIPADSNSFDTVVFTYTLCSIPSPIQALSEIRRVIKPKGRVIFCEHGKAPDKDVQTWQNMIGPIWKKLAGGCMLNRDIPYVIQNNGFKIQEMDARYVSGWKPASFNYMGTATVR